MLLNEYDIQDLQGRFADDLPNLQRGVTVLTNLMEWTNSHSDGWPYWVKPSRAANRLQELLQAASNAYRRGDVEDATDAELKAALRPIKAFLTRQGVAHTEVF